MTSGFSDFRLRVHKPAGVRTRPVSHNASQRRSRINALSPMVLTKYVASAMVTDDGGRIVNLAPIVAFTGYGGRS